MRVHCDHDWDELLMICRKCSLTKHRAYSVTDKVTAQANYRNVRIGTWRMMCDEQMQEWMDQASDTTTDCLSALPPVPRQPPIDLVTLNWRRGPHGLIARYL